MSPADQNSQTLARQIIDDNLYLVLATADAEGLPWASPVYYAPASRTEFLWVSRPYRTHSLNIAVRPEISIVIFNSQVPINTGQAVYMRAVAKQVADGDLNQAVRVFSRRSLEHGDTEFTIDDVRGPSALRLYIATATEQYILDGDDNRVPIAL